MTSIGPFSIQSIGVIAAFLLSGLVTRALAKHLPSVSQRLASAVLLDAAFWGIVAARLGYIAFWWEDYFATPMAMIAIGDGGYYWWVGVPATLAFVWWRTRSMPVQRRPIFVGVLAGVIAWFAGSAILPLLHESPRLPDVQLATMVGSQSRSDHLKGVRSSSISGRVGAHLVAAKCPSCNKLSLSSRTPALS